jgi:uncharacterized protein YbjT (DUF2867 family)
MKIVVIGGSGLIGSKLVNKLGEHGHEALSASPDSGVDTLTGAGLPEALEGASVVIDVSNSPSFEDAAAMEFFETSTSNLLAAEAAAGDAHPEDVASGVGRVSVGSPLNGIVEIAGPEQFRLDELVRGVLAARNDPREVITDPQARYFGINPSERTLLPGAGARLAETRFDEWRKQQLATA